MIRRGHVHWVDLDPAQGSEAAKRRPAVVVSNDRANATAERLGRGVVTVVPLTSNTAHVFAFQVLVEPDESGMPRESKAQAEQVRSVSVRRLDGDPVGKLSTRTLAALDDALRLHLDLH
ncbi:type II toxin-antitoxin system PemK/MazF family toxin [Rhodococcus sp. DMU1]|uniref:type II toxin-antitoxin system PemK/MazF family toxin n=1 Tax=Rhodococcus TaxID=1827 RepID=UPI00143E1123|nr:type II toxin-antitoxin system PemK/MazF family toxin [Rhodococcus sp. DMU1]QIX53988.1 type II toxin-antitoxin system PemK/MazF family toxin [Rhodococcus sp. DMU1]